MLNIWIYFLYFKSTLCNTTLNSDVYNQRLLSRKTTFVQQIADTSWCIVGLVCFTVKFINSISFCVLGFHFQKTKILNALSMFEDTKIWWFVRIYTQECHKLVVLKHFSCTTQEILPVNDLTTSFVLNLKNMCSAKSYLPR